MTNLEDEQRTERTASQPAAQPRAGWAEQFALMAERGDGRLLYDGGLATTWDETAWEW